MGQVTMKHLAERLGVSVTTVSNAYNKPERLSSELREKILATGDAMGYCGPDAAGRLLRRGKADSVGVYAGSGLAYVFGTHHANMLLTGVAQVLERQGQSLCLLTVGRGGEGAAHVQSAVIDALICLTELGHSEVALDAARRRGLPLVFTHKAEGESYSAIDDVETGRLAGAHLRELGHRRVGVISGLRREHRKVSLAEAREVNRAHKMEWAALRLEGIEAGLGAEASVQVVIRRGDDSYAAGRDAAAALLDDDPGITALVALSDELAFGVLDEVAARGLVPGKTISVVGFDGVPGAESRGLTTVVQPTVEKGRVAAELALDPERQPRQVILPVELVVRDSTGPAPTA